MPIFSESIFKLLSQNSWTTLNIFALSSFVILYERLIAKKPVLHVRQNTAFALRLKHGMSSVLDGSKYRPPFWCFESRMQTVLATFFRFRNGPMYYEREIFQLRDGGEVALDWVKNSKDPDHIILLLPGLTGSSQSCYNKNFINFIGANLPNCNFVVFNFRGRGDLPLKTARTYNAANSDDLEEVLVHLGNEYPDCSKMGIGVSMGGIVLGNFLCRKGEEGNKYLKGAFIVSCCLNVFKGTESLEQPILNLKFNHHLAEAMVEGVKQHADLFSGHPRIDMSEVFKSQTIRDVDRSFTVPQFGYKSVDEYYNDVNLSGKMSKIKVPTLALNAEDDPFQLGCDLPLSEIENECDNVAILTTEFGGHIGFLEGAFWPSRVHFSDRVALAFTKMILEEKK